MSKNSPILVKTKQLIDMAKIAIKSTKITAFGGIFLVEDEINRLQIPKLVDETLGKRGTTKRSFKYGDVFKSLFMSYLCSADCLEDINYLGKQFSLRPKTRVPSADTVGRALKNLAVEDTVYNCPESHKSYKFNTADKLNELMLRMIRHLGLIKPYTEVDLDFDHQFIAAHKYDAKYSYKQDYGYFPGWAMVNGIFVGGENRDGCTNVRFKQEETLERIMSRMERVLNVKIGRFRADCGSYSRNVIETVERHCRHFYIRASNCGSRIEEFRSRPDEEWNPVEIGFAKCDVSSFDIEGVVDGEKHRLVVQRAPERDENGQVEKDLFGIVYNYRCIITNDWESTGKEIIDFYNGRGKIEKNFDIQNNDFGWGHLPFSFLNENTVFMLATAMLKNLFVYLIQKLKGKVASLRETSRLKKFILHFVSVAAKWTSSGRQDVLNLYTDRRFYTDTLWI